LHDALVSEAGVSSIAEAASVLLARGPGSAEVFLVTRAANLRFLGGFLAFPGGKVHASDADLTRPSEGLTGRHVAACRELFEEAGVLLARDGSGNFPPASPQLEERRRLLLADRLTFRDLLAEFGLHLRADDLAPAGSLLTPEFSPHRFDTAFFVANLPPGQEATVWPGELTAGIWQTADNALREWEAGKTLLSPPTVALLECVRGRPIHDLPARLRPVLDALASGPHPPIWFSPAVQMVPLRCQGLPPSTHTNAYLVGTGPVYLLDPGPESPDEQQHLFSVLDIQAAAGRRLSAVVLTHHHSDHVGAAAACARRYGVPILAHPLTRNALAGRVEVSGDLLDGQLLDLGPAPDGVGRWHLEALATPGHAAGHLCFWEPRYRLLFAGDMVSTLSSVVIAPPGGDLTLYLDSLHRLQALPARLLLPAHGSPSARPAFVIEECLAHRRVREEQLLAALADEPRPVLDLVQELYRGLPANLIRFAELQTLAGLHKLQREGRAVPDESSGESAWRRPPAQELPRKS
jgi:ribonuclease/clavin/mitogillin